MSNHDAHRGLSDTARLRLVSNDPMEDTQVLDVATRRGRQAEAYAQHCVPLKARAWPQIPPANPNDIDLVMTTGDVQHRQRQAYNMHAQGCVIDEGHRILVKLRERRSASTVGERRPTDSEQGIAARQAVIDFINEGSMHI